MNTIEFRLRENNTGSFPRGISVMLRSLQSWLYDRDAVEPLAWARAARSASRRGWRSGERVFETLIRDNVARQSASHHRAVHPRSGVGRRRKPPRSGRGSMRPARR